MVEHILRMQEVPSSIPSTVYIRHGGGCLQSQHSRGRGRNTRSSRSPLNYTEVLGRPERSESWTERENLSPNFSVLLIYQLEWILLVICFWFLSDDLLCFVLCSQNFFFFLFWSSSYLTSLPPFPLPPLLRVLHFLCCLLCFPPEKNMSLRDINKTRHT